MERQSNWRGWTWRDARRLAKAQSLVGPLEKPELGPYPGTAMASRSYRRRRSMAPPVVIKPPRSLRPR
jgi:hypothetical protein